jgi:hypothetical protein
MTLYNKFARGLPTIYAYFQEGCPNYIQMDNLCAIPLDKVKFKVKNKEATDSYKNYKRFIPK